MLKIGINGFGRIGRCVYRIVLNRPDVQIVGINDIADPVALAYLLKYDTVMGRLGSDVTLEGNTLSVDGQDARLMAERDPAKLPWKELGVDLVVEATGRFKTRADLQKHLDAGAERVILTVPPCGAHRRDRGPGGQRPPAHRRPAHDLQRVVHHELPGALGQDH
jgi:glyceraldehyde 3-phosphate dehydrogenase